MLEDHLTWWTPRDDRPFTEFTSWISSLLFAVQLAVRKTRRSKKQPFKSEEEDVKLCVLDTSNLGTIKQNFFAAKNLINHFGIDEVTYEWYTTEYLYHAALNVRDSSSTVSLFALRIGGLFELLPWFDIEETKTKLYGRVKELRATLPNKRTILSADGGLALEIASHFGGKFIMPMFVA